MKNTAIILAFISLSQLYAACSWPRSGSQPAANQSNAAIRNSSEKTANDKAEELGMLILLPAEPTEVAWREEPQGEGRKRLIAVMRFEPADANKVGEEAAKFRPPTDGELDTEVWFPQELTAQSEMGEGTKLRGREFVPDIVLQPPYIRGRLVRIENTDYYYLDAYTF